LKKKKEENSFFVNKFIYSLKKSLVYLSVKDRPYLLLLLSKNIKKDIE
jgi:hypothetical protein